MNNNTTAIFLLLLATLVAGGSLQAQPVTFQRNYASYSLMRPQKVFPENDGYVVVGSHSTGSNYFLSFFDLAGNLLRTSVVGTPSNLDSYGDCIRTADGGFLFVGSSFMLPENPDGESTLLVKTDRDGNQQWLRSYTLNPGGVWPYYVFERGKGVAAADGGYVIASSYARGVENVPNVLDIDFLIRRVDSLGNEVQGFRYGGPLGDLPSKVIHLKDGGYAVSGYTQFMGECDTDTLPDAVNIPLLIKLSETDISQVLWSVSTDTLPLPAAFGCTQDWWETLMETPSGDVFAIGDKGGVPSAFVFDPAGGSLVLHKPWVTGFFFDKTADGWVGISQGSYGVMWYDQEFNVTSFRPYGSDTRLVNIAVTPDGGLIMPTRTNDMFGLMKTDCEGNIQNPINCLSPIQGQTTQPSRLTLSPNPASDHVSLHTEAAGIAGAEITDMLGRTVLLLDGNGENLLECGLTATGSGVFFVKVRLTDGKTITERLIVE